MIRHSVATGQMAQPVAEAFFNLKSYMTQVLLFTLVMGIVTTAIVALFTKRIRKNAIAPKEHTQEKIRA